MLNLLKNLNRWMGVGLALHSGSFNIQYIVDGSPAQGPLSLPGDGYDCVNKPIYKCKEQVEKAGTICSKCRVRINTLLSMPTLILLFGAINMWILNLCKAANRPVGGQAMYPNSFRVEYCAEYPLEDAHYDEAPFHS